MKKLIFILIIILILCSIYYFTKRTTIINLYQELGYNESEIVIINSLHNAEIILSYDYNSKFIEIISNKEFKEENLEYYIEMLDKYEIEIENIIFVVNSNFYNGNVVYNSETVSLMRVSYYINDNLTRYMDYKNKYPTMDIIDIVINVNCNLDYNFYTNTSNADLSKDYLVLVNFINWLVTIFLLI